MECAKKQTGPTGTYCRMLHHSSGFLRGSFQSVLAVQCNCSMLSHMGVANPVCYHIRYRQRKTKQLERVNKISNWACQCAMMSGLACLSWKLAEGFPHYLYKWPVIHYWNKYAGHSATLFHLPRDTIYLLYVVVSELLTGLMSAKVYSSILSRIVTEYNKRDY